jgi:HD-GYP domain-containing protein (c-di-GMP phosphodiesterase class II)
MKSPSRGTGPTRRVLVFLCGVVPVFLAAVLAIFRPAFLARIDDTVYDTVTRSARLHPRADRVVIVDVDERSLSTIGQWPWRRDVIARLVDRLRAMGASTIALDVIFAEPDRYERPAVPERRSSKSPPRSSDDLLAQTLRGGRVVLGYALTFDAAASARRACELHPIGLAIVHPREEVDVAPFFRATGAVCSLPALSQAAGVSGFLNAAPDSDGILRRVPLVAELDGRVYPSLALEAVGAVIGTRDLVLRVSNVNASSLMIGDLVVPVDGKSNLLLRYRGKKKTFPYVSAADVLSGDAPGEILRDKIVFVGTTALGTREVVATPLDTLFAGIEVQATIADNLLQEDFIRRSPLGPMLESQIVVLFGVGIAAIVAGTGVVTGLASCAGAVAALWVGAIWLLSTSGLFISPLYPTISVLSAVAVITLAKFTVERRRADTASRERSTAQQLMVQTLLSLTEVRDAETGRHSRRTQRYARLLAEQLTAHPDFREYLTPERIDLLSSLAPLHDIGKVGIPDRILNKPGALTQEELAEMRKHPTLGREVILKAEQQAGVRDDATLNMAKDIVYTHHERWDGTGYPQGLRGTDIPIAGRLMAVVDVYDAVGTRQLYGPSMAHDETVRFIVSGKGTHFDPTVVDAFVKVAPRLRFESGLLSEDDSDDRAFLPTAQAR